MKISLWMTVAATVSLIFASANTWAAESKDEPVAQINGKKITLEEFNRKFNEVKSETVNPPTRQQFLEDLVRYEIGLQEAEKRGLEKDPLVKERMKQELYKALLEKELGEKVQKAKISKQEMEDYYKKNPEIRISHILVSFRIGSTPEQKAEAKKRAEEIYAEVKASKRPFEELVKIYSDDSLSKPSGGDVGWQSRVTLVPSVYDAAVNMKPGEVKGILETQFGYHIIKVTDRRAFDKADKEKLRVEVFDEKRRQTFNEFFEKLKKSYTVKTNPRLIE